MMNNAPSFPPPPPPPNMGGMVLPPGVPPPPGAMQQQQQQPPMPPPLPPSEQQQQQNNNNTNNGYIRLLDTLHLNLNNHPQNAAQTVVLSHLPSFLRGVRVLRDSSYPCGSARTVHIGCCVPVSGVECRKMTERGLLSSSAANSSHEEKDIMKKLHWEGAHGGVAVVKMGHFIGAQDFAGGLLALVRCGQAEKLPVKPGSNINGTTSATANDNTVGKEEQQQQPVAGDNSEEVVTNESNTQPTSNTTSSNGNTNGSDKKAPEPEEIDTDSQYTKEERIMYYKTLSQLKQMHVYHLFNHSIPTPIPPDMNVPQADPKPSDPNMPYHLLEALTTLRLRYEEQTKEGSDEKNALSTSVSYITDDQWGGHAAAAGTDDGTTANANNDNDPDGIGNFKMDKAKIAAAAGGVSGYDEDADPLNAPDVVKAVLAFKRRLEDQNFKGKKRRIEIINGRMEKKVKELIDKGRAERENRKLMLKQREEQTQGQQQQQQMVPPPPPPVPPVEATDTGRRGVSNLPAWMTKGTTADNSNAAANANDQAADAAEDDSKKRKFVPSEANRDINVRKQKLDMAGGQSLSEIRAANEAADKQKQDEESSFVVQTTKEGILSSSSKFPTLPSTAVDVLKPYVTSQIIDFLGEEESTLIEFIMKELQKEGGCTTASLLEEMKVVLDEDAEDFVLGLYRKMTVE